MLWKGILNLVLDWLSSNPMFPLFFQLLEKCPWPKWTIYKHESDKNRKCLSVCCYLWPTYTSLCRGLKKLLKVPYIIQDYPTEPGFFIFEILCLDTSKTLPYVWKKYHKNERYLCLERPEIHQSFTEYVSNQLTYSGISTCQMWLQVMEHTLILLLFFVGYFDT